MCIKKKPKLVINKIYQRLLKVPLYALILVATGLCLLINIFVSFFSPVAENINSSLSIGEQLLLMVFIAPLVETYIFQDIPYKILKNKLHPTIIIVLSGLIFGLAHLSTGTSNFFVVTIVGFIFMALYILVYYRTKGKAVVTVFIVHALLNLIAVVLHLAAHQLAP
ncbi:CPBP family intramembrane glutamic endopeptidase [Sphingobacterium sp. xlx-130]|uniref:CPBP family intramembrane glutamic endopeptidase n=1 Tax=Sphingobacterium sp. xlx-130 TaxID=2654323 RepID=UPI0013DB2767|nr:CPBP family intramembrane glutamic endopeptidase [Sphingobacterium sp. xlx-130]